MSEYNPVPYIEVSFAVGSAPFKTNWDALDMQYRENGTAHIWLEGEREYLKTLMPNETTFVDGISGRETLLTMPADRVIHLGFSIHTH